MAVFICLATKTLEKVNTYKLSELDKEKEIVSNLLNSVMAISGQMSEGIVDVTEHMQELGDAVSETRNAMQEVSEGTSDTAESIQNQLSKTEEIQNYIEQMAKVVESIADSMAQAKQNVGSGRENIDMLLKQMSASERVGKEAVEDMKVLEEYTQNMQSIIDLITSVASQTSLLSLNASIEAARAGEAGRGFAVVATEISNLANKTQDATVKITEVIQNVSSKLQIAVEAVGQLMDSNRRQSESAVQASDSFGMIAESTNRVNEQSTYLSDAVSRLSEANSGIVESIQTISAIVQEVTAHSQETDTVSDRNTGIVQEVSLRPGTEEGTVVLSATVPEGDEIRNKILREFVYADIPVLELKSAGKSLEEIFLALTNPGHLPQEEDLPQEEFYPEDPLFPEHDVSGEERFPIQDLLQKEETEGGDLDDSNL